MFSLKERRLTGDLTTVSQYLKCVYKEDGDSIIEREHMEKMRGNEFKLILEIF